MSYNFQGHFFALIINCCRTCNTSRPIRESGFRNPGNFSLLLEFENLGFGIWNIVHQESGIQVPLTWGEYNTHQWTRSGYKLSKSDYDGHKIFTPCTLYALITLEILSTRYDMNFVFIGSVTVNPPIKIPPNPKCSDNFCRQECRDIPNEGAKCYCRSGYQLQSDRVSCQGKITMNAHFRVFYLLLNIPRPPIQCWDATEQLRRAQSHIR